MEMLREEIKQLVEKYSILTGLQRINLLKPYVTKFRSSDA